MRASAAATGPRMTSKATQAIPGARHAIHPLDGWRLLALLLGHPADLGAASGPSCAQCSLPQPLPAAAVSQPFCSQEDALASIDDGIEGAVQIAVQNLTCPECPGTGCSRSVHGDVGDPVTYVVEGPPESGCSGRTYRVFILFSSTDTAWICCSPCVVPVPDPH